MDIQDDGAQAPANWAEKSVVVKNKEKNAGYTVESGLLKGEFQSCKVITIEAEGAEEAALAVRSFFGAGINTGAVLACKSSSLTETVAQ